MLYYGLVGHVASVHLATVSLPAGKSLRSLRYVFISLDLALPFSSSDTISQSSAFTRPSLLALRSATALTGAAVAQAAS